MNEHLKLMGILHIKNALQLPDNIEQIYDDVSERLEGFSIRKNNSICLPVISAFEKDKVFRDILMQSGFKKTIDSVLGGGLLYSNDLSTFKGGSNWHRDSYNRLPLWKFAVYLDGSYGDDQHFLYIPGSHHWGDKFAHGLQDFSNWPRGAGLLAGLNSDYSINNSTSNIQPCAIKINRGDIIAFDIRILHAVFSQNNSPRRLISTIFMPDLHQAVYEPGCGSFENENKYRDFLWQHRCASHICELKNGRKIYSSHQNYSINDSDFSNMLFFNNMNEIEINSLATKLFGSGEVGHKRALNFICNTSL